MNIIAERFHVLKFLHAVVERLSSINILKKIHTREKSFKSLFDLVKYYIKLRGDIWIIV